jgi:hypothetical protein
MTSAHWIFGVLAVTVGLGLSHVRAVEYCPDMVKYVCGTKGGRPSTYINSCFARADGASNIALGKCEGEDISQMRFCPELIIPVCASKNGRPTTYGNACIAIADGVRILHKGYC